MEKGTVPSGSVLDEMKKEYLYNLQIRQKWNKTHRNVQIGDIVTYIERRISCEMPVEAS